VQKALIERRALGDWRTGLLDKARLIAAFVLAMAAAFAAAGGAIAGTQVPL
jgi:hypothetical protein